jgi:hypothetical protein
MLVLGSLGLMLIRESVKNLFSKPEMAKQPPSRPPLGDYVLLGALLLTDM